MAIAFDTSLKPAITNCCGNTSFSYTCSGNDRLLIWSYIRETGSDTAPTYAGVSLTLLTSQSVGGRFVHFVYYLLNPASGANTFSVNRSGYGLGVASSYTGVSQVGFPDSSNLGNSTTITATVSTTVVASNCWVICCSAAAFNSSSYIATSNKTDRQATTAMQPATPYLGCAVGDSNGTVSTGAYSVDYSESGGGGTQYNTSGISLSIAPLVPSLPKRQWQSIAKIRASTY